MTPEKKIVAIVLAAGKSSRMQDFKLGLPFKEHTILEEVLTHLRASEVEQMVVVSGHFQQEIAALTQHFPDVKRVHNPHYSTGMSSSIKAGLQAADPTCAGILICLADMPLIPTAVYRLLLQTFRENTSQGLQIIRPGFQGKPGHPVLFSKHFRSDLLNLDYPEGARMLVRAKRDLVTVVEVDSPGILQDIDTRDQYQEHIKKTGLA